MARRKLTLEDQLKGVRAAIESRRTPPQLKDGLKRRADELQTKINSRGKTSQKPGRKGWPFDLMWD